MAASWPVTPSTARNFIRWPSAAFTSTGGVLLMFVLPFSLYCLMQWFTVSNLLGYSPHGIPKRYQAAKRQRPKNGYPDDVGQHQRDHRANTRVLVVFLGKPNHQSEVRVQRRKGIMANRRPGRPPAPKPDRPPDERTAARRPARRLPIWRSPGVKNRFRNVTTTIKPSSSHSGPMFALLSMSAILTAMSVAMLL